MCAQWRCNYVNTDNTNPNSLFRMTVEDGIQRYVDSIGPTCYRTDSGDNFKYSRGAAIFFFDKKDTVQGLSLATVIMGAITWAFCLFAGCFRFAPPLWLLVGLLCAATAVTEGLVFQQMFTYSYVCEDDGVHCSWGTGAKCAISAMTFWSLSCIMTCGRFEEAQAENNGEDGGSDSKERVEEDV